MDLLSSRLDTSYNGGVRISGSQASRCASCTMRAAFGRSEVEYSRLVSKSSAKLLDSLWDKKLIPEDGWPDHALELFLSWLACHDTNNRVDMVLGFYNLVEDDLEKSVDRLGKVTISEQIAMIVPNHTRSSLTHGIGRSGNIADIQPKALGSSMLACVTSCKAALVVPICTGMALSLCMGSWRRLRPEAKYVLWLRVDQKSCFKSIFHAGFEPLIVDPVRDGDALVTDIETVNRILEQRADQVALIMVKLFWPQHKETLSWLD
ncbi:putative O-phosphoseryl-tRNA(Sec) selenium transferase [Ostertagia ostertagi]